MSVLEVVDACGEREKIVIVAKRWSKVHKKDELDPARVIASF